MDYPEHVGFTYRIESLHKIINNYGSNGLLIEIDDMQFGFVKGKGTINAIFIVRLIQENLRVEDKKLYFGFVDLEKAFDRVPREVISLIIIIIIIILFAQ